MDKIETTTENNKEYRTFKPVDKMPETTELDVTGKELYHSPEFMVLCRRFNIPYGMMPSSFKLEFANHGMIKVTQEIPLDTRQRPPDQETTVLGDSGPVDQHSPQRGKKMGRMGLPRDNHEPDPRHAST